MAEIGKFKPYAGDMETDVLITCGCSLSPTEFWPRYTAKYLNIDVSSWMHLGAGGSSNGLQMYRLQNQILKLPDMKNVTIIYQVTGQNRSWYICNEMAMQKTPALFTEEDRVKSGDAGYNKWVLTDNYIDKKPRALCLNHHEKTLDLHLERVPAVCQNHVDPEYEQQQLLFTLSMLRQAGANVFVFRGWSGVLPEENWEVFKDKFNQTGVKYTNECLVEWCLENNYPFIDDYHPEGLGSCAFIHHKIFPLM